jgi:hypothetical protein
MPEAEDHLGLEVEARVEIDKQLAAVAASIRRRSTQSST